tara:strand:+ start:1187 stop:1861 length:675 start_codon:yes stop_codon:yes gene_type:complete
MVIAIDGPSGSGKTSSAKMLSEELGFYYCDSGSLYRAVTYFLIENCVDLNNDVHIKEYIKNITVDYIIDKNKIYINNIDVTSKLRSIEVTNSVSLVSSKKVVRDKLIDIQRSLANDNNLVLDGRDIGTTVFPHADFKFFLDADVSVRANRRYDEILVAQKEKISYKEICIMIEKRDEFDRNRKYSPLIKAKDALRIDTTHLTLDEQVKKMVNFINKQKKQDKVN